jgi:hypothetical protein
LFSALRPRPSCQVSALFGRLDIFEATALAGEGVPGASEDVPSTVTVYPVEEAAPSAARKRAMQPAAVVKLLGGLDKMDPADRLLFGQAPPAKRRRRTQNRGGRGAAAKAKVKVKVKVKAKKAKFRLTRLRLKLKAASGKKGTPLSKKKGKGLARRTPNRRAGDSPAAGSLTAGPALDQVGERRSGKKRAGVSGRAQLLAELTAPLDSGPLGLVDEGRSGRREAHGAETVAPIEQDLLQEVSRLQRAAPHVLDERAMQEEARIF